MTTIFKLPESGEVALTANAVIDHDDFQRFVGAGGIIYARGFSVEVRANGGHGNVTYIKPRTDDLHTRWQHAVDGVVDCAELGITADYLHTRWQRAAEHFKKLSVDRADEGTSVQLACLVLAECCVYEWSGDRGGPTPEMVALAENTLGLRIDEVVAEQLRGYTVP